MEATALKPTPSAEQRKHIHLIGICGTAMASLAGLLQQKGHRITGSDHFVIANRVSYKFGLQGTR